MSGFSEYGRYDALGLADLIERGDVSRSEVVEEAVKRIEGLNSELGAVVRERFDRAREESRSADGPLAGVPFLLKDLHADLAGEITASGSQFLRRHHAPADSELARRYRDAGLCVLGKTNTPEFGLFPVTEPRAFGVAKNPWDTRRTPGGSSGGSAAAVAAGLVPMAHGSDGGGSIRIPAACCGLFGLKPTRGRVPTGPAAGERWRGLSQDHVISRSVRDSAAALDAVAGPEPGGPYRAPPPEARFLDEARRDPGRLRLALATEPAMPSRVEADCLRAARDAAELCRSLGHEVAREELGCDSSQLAEDFLKVVAADTAAELDRAERALGRRAGRDELETPTWLAVELGRQISAAELVSALERLWAESRRLAARFSGFDAIITPALGRAPVLHGALEPPRWEAALQELVVRARAGIALKLPGVAGRAAESLFSVAAYTPVANFTGRPSMSVPLWWNAEGLPVGALFTGRFGDEATLFRLAAQLEEARPWFHRRPPVTADPSAR